MDDIPLLAMTSLRIMLIFGNLVGGSSFHGDPFLSELALQFLADVVEPSLATPL